MPVPSPDLVDGKTCGPPPSSHSIQSGPSSCPLAVELQRTATRPDLTESAPIGRVRSELVNDQGKRLSSLTIQDDIRSVDLSIAGSGIRRQLATYELRKRDALPTAMTQQFMGSGHRFYPTAEGSYKFIHGPARFLRTEGDRRNRCEDILDSVVQFRNEQSRMIPLAAKQNICRYDLDIQPHRFRQQRDQTHR